MLERTEEIEPLEFCASPDPTVGVEMELWIVDPETRQLVSRARQFFDHFEDKLLVKRELWQAMMEINTGICPTVAAARKDLETTINQVSEAADGFGVSLMSSGTHPFSDWREQQMSEDPRYARLLEIHRWPAARLLISGLHVHVGVDSGEKAIAIVNSITSYLPHMIALSASSPFWRYGDTGLISSRCKIFDGLPKAGLPPFLLNWAEFTRLMRTLLNSKTIHSIRDVWWDVRPHLGFGTVEVRICDALPTLSENMALVALVQTLVAHLSDLYDQGYPIPVLRHWTLVENKWRAIRHGLDAQIIRNEHGDLVSVVDHLRETLELLSPTAERLGCAEEIGFIENILERGNSSMRQHEVWHETHDMKHVVDTLIKEFASDQMLGPGGEESIEVWKHGLS